MPKLLGTYKLLEELGELVQAVAKREGLNRHRRKKKRERLQANMNQDVIDEMGDVLAAISYYVEKNNIDWEDITARRDAKLAKYMDAGRT